MQIFDNIRDIVKDDLKVTITKGSRVSIAAACFSMYAYQELKHQLDQVDQFRFVLTLPHLYKSVNKKNAGSFTYPA